MFHLHSEQAFGNSLGDRISQKCTGLLISIAMDFDMIHSNPKNQLWFRASGWRRRCAGSWRQRETAGSREQSRRHEGILPGRCVARPRHSSRNPMKQEFGQRWIFLRRGATLFCVGINMVKKTDSQRHVTHDWIAKDHIMIDKYVIWSEYEHNVPLLEFTRSSSMTPLGRHRVGQFILWQLAVIKFNSI